MNESEALIRCSIQNWYPIFYRNTFKTRIVRISPAVSAWLVEDGIVLPDVDRAVRDFFLVPPLKMCL